VTVNATIGIHLMRISSSTYNWLAVWAPLPIRLVVGYGFMAHGYAKFSRGPEKFAAVLHTLGVPEPLLAAWAATLTELIGGAAVMVGALIPWVSIPMTVVLLTALVTVHLPYGFFSVKFAEVSEAGIKFGTLRNPVALSRRPGGAGARWPRCAVAGTLA